MPPERCASHPARVSAGPCPVCERPRCGAEAGSYGLDGCSVCAAQRRAAASGGPSRARLIAALLVGYLVALIGGAVTSQYVGASGFDLAAPALTGLAIGLAMSSVVRTRGTGPLDWPLRAVAAFLGLLATALSFRLVVGGDDPFSPLREVGPPYLAAVAGAVASRVLR